MDDVKKALFEKAKFFNESALKFVDDDDMCNMYCAMATGVEIVIQACDLWKEYVEVCKSEEEK